MPVEWTLHINAGISPTLISIQLAQLIEQGTNEYMVLGSISAFGIFFNCPNVGTCNKLYLLTVRKD